jgi:hypothetical protein
MEVALKMWSKSEAKILPKKLPSLYCAYYAFAKLGECYNSKQTGVLVGKLCGKDGFYLANCKKVLGLCKCNSRSCDQETDSDRKGNMQHSSIEYH